MSVPGPNRKSRNVRYMSRKRTIADIGDDAVLPLHRSDEWVQG
jgi:hypothetical protein